MSGLKALSEGLAAAVAASAASVVEVRGRRRPASGLAVGEEWVVTAEHALRRDDGLRIRAEDGVEREAVLVGRDPATDLALLRVEGAALTPATWSDGAVAVGHLVLPLARAEGRVRAVLGLVSAVGGPWQTGLGATVDAWIDVDAALPPGFSGGPLVDAEGRVIGLDTTALTPRGAVIPGSTVRRVVERLRDHGSVAPGYLGVGFYPGTLPEALATAAGQVEALLAVSLEPGGPGAQAGVQVGDALIGLDGAPVTGLRHLLGLLSARGAGREVTLSLLRAGARVELPVVLGTRPRPKRC